MRKPLADLREGSSSEYVFCDKFTGKLFRAIKNAFKTACRRAGIKGLWFHDLRHTFATRRLAGGVALVTVKELLGHADIKTTERYVHTSPDAKKKAITAPESNNKAEYGHKSVTDENSEHLDAQHDES